jgi:hypothetical protein
MMLRGDAVGTAAFGGLESGARGIGDSVELRNALSRSSQAYKTNPLRRRPIRSVLKVALIAKRVCVTLRRVSAVQQMLQRSR